MEIGSDTKNNRGRRIRGYFYWIRSWKKELLFFRLFLYDNVVIVLYGFNFPGREDMVLSLIHISEPTRRS